MCNSWASGAIPSTHSLRRTAITRLHAVGVGLRTIQRISGHRSLAALQRYIEVSLQ
ncbi:MAG: tyrosine-type recombinase/integrase [Anaerolineae bacterium]|nr:tyrosine-type recombinase/integrase [Gloeobacterales cyanobacterium ES-bin-313]